MSSPSWHWAPLGNPHLLGRSLISIGDLTVMDNPNASQRPYAFDVSDGHLWVKWWDGAAWHWADQGTPTGAAVTASAGVVTVKDNPNAAQRPYAFVRGSNGVLWVNWWDGAARHWADQGTPSGTTVADGAGAITVKDNPNASQRPYAFVHDADSQLWVN